MIRAERLVLVKFMTAYARNEPADSFNDGHVREQLQSLAVVELTRLRQELFAIRMSFKDFADRYDLMLTSDLRKICLDPYEVSFAVLGQVEGNNSKTACKFAKHKIFLSAEFHAQLEQHLSVRLWTRVSYPR